MEGGSKGMVLLALIGIGLFFFWYGTKDDSTIIKTPIPITPPLNNIPNQPNTTQINLPDEDKDAVIDSQDLCGQTSTGEIVDVQGCSDNQFNPTELNACGKYKFGLPDFEGTNNAGKTCKDFVVSERDLICVANPPKRYDGLIVGASSDPIIYCCFSDGSCNW